MKKTLIKRPKVVNKDTTELRNAILRYVDRKTAKSIRPFDLRCLGYLFDNTAKVTLRGTGLELWRIVDADSRREASFCILLLTKTNMGAVVPKAYSELLEVANE